MSESWKKKIDNTGGQTKGQTDRQTSIHRTLPQNLECIEEVLTLLGVNLTYSQIIEVSRPFDCILA